MEPALYEPKKILVGSGKGGTGKTFVSLVLAVRLAMSRTPTVLVDGDTTQDKMSATSVLDAAEQRDLSDGRPGIETLSWISLQESGASLSELATRLGEFRDESVVIDIKPDLFDPDLHKLVGAVDLVLVPGHIDEFETIHRMATLSRDLAPEVPVAAVITKTDRQTLTSKVGLENQAWLSSNGVEIAADLRQNARAARAIMSFGFRPDQLDSSDNRHTLALDSRELMAYVDKALWPTKGAS